MAVCTARSRLSESLSSAGAIIQYANGIVDFQQENCIGAATALPAVRLMSRVSIKRITGSINVPSAWIALASAENRRA